MTGTALGTVASVLLSLTLEPEVSESRMAQYGGFIGLVSSSVVAALMSSKNSNQKTVLEPHNRQPNLGFSTILTQTITNGIQNHLDSLQPGSPEYLKALELYGQVLSAENATLPTNTRKSQNIHHNQGGDYR